MPQQSFRHHLGFCSQITTSTGGQHSSPVVFPEKQKRSKVKALRRGGDATAATPTPTFDPEKPISFEHKIDIGGPGVVGGDEKSNLLGYVVFSGKLVLDKSKTANLNPTSTDAKQQTSTSESASQDAVDARLTSKALIWGTHMLPLEDVVSVRSPSFL